VTAPLRYLLIANPGTKRCETYRAELAAFWASRNVAVELEILPWAELVPRDGNLLGHPAADRPAIVRMESPGKDARVARLLLEAGARADPNEPARDWQSCNYPKGLLLRPGLLHRGFHRVLLGLRRSFDLLPHLQPTACPLAVAEMFDKTATSAKLHAAGIPVPESLDDPRDSLARVGPGAGASRWSSLYLKLNTGSSAAGMIAIQSNGGDPCGITTMAEVDGRMFNSRRLRTVRGEALARAAGFCVSEGAFAQRGIAMEKIDAQNFDVRVVCIAGKVAATIFRLSPHPMTNLQLGGRRGNAARCRAHVPTRAWLDALDHCAEAAGCFASTVAGVDLLFERGWRRHFVLEVNAFGDFFPGWTDLAGRSIHALEIAATITRPGLAAGCETT
jgi:hypothetical protein